MLNLNLNWVSETIKTIKDWWPVVKSNFQQIQNNYNSHISGTSDKHLAEHITYSGVVSGASNVKQGIDNIKNSYNGHINGDSDKHAAEHITFASNRLTLPDDNVKNAIETVDMRIEQIIQGQSIDPNKDVEVLASRTSSIYGEFPTLTERLDNADTIINNINAKIDAPDYSAPQEATESIITLPSTVVEGQFSDITAKGNTWINKLGIHKTQNSILALASGANLGFSLDGGIIAGVGSKKVNLTSGHVYFIKVKWLSGTNNNVNLLRTYAGQVLTDGTILGTVTNVGLETYLRFVAPATDAVYLALRNNTAESNYYHDKSFIYDLTEIFGIGNEPNVDECNSILWYVDGVKSTLSARVKSVEKNLLNYKNFSENTGVTIEYIDNGFRLKASSGTWKVLKYKNIKLKPNVQYTISRNIQIITAGAGSWNGAIRVFIAGTETELGLMYRTDSDNKMVFTAPPTGLVDIWIYVTAAVSEATEFIFTNVQLEEGAAATTYEPYKETVAYLPNVVLRSLPNGVKDEASVTKGEKTQRVGKATIDGSLNWGSSKTRDNTYRCAVTLWGTNNNAANYSNNNIFAISSTGTIYRATEYEENDFEFVTILYGSLYVSIEKSKVDAMAGADTTAKFKAYLNQYPITLIYQLASEIITQGTAQSLVAMPGGHIIIECIKRVTKPYDSGITVDTPIEVIESVTKIVDGVRIPVDLSKVTVASDKLSLTITDAADNEVYEIIYAYNGVLPTVRFSYPMNIAASIANIAKGAAANSKTINDFINYQNAVNLQFDLRITALEP